MKSIFFLSMIFCSFSFAVDPAGYDEEMLHNSVHSFIEAMEIPRVFQFKQEDTAKLRETFQEMDKAVNHVHDQLEDHNGYKAVRRAVEQLRAPAGKFYTAARENQLLAGKRMLHTDEIFSFMAMQNELEFWTMPVEAPASH